MIRRTKTTTPRRSIDPTIMSASVPHDKNSSAISEMKSSEEVVIVSLLASITEILAALGVSRNIVGVTHCCDYPPSALADAIVVTTSAVNPKKLTQAEIHERVSGALRRGDSLYDLNVEALRGLQPTHVFTQSLCDVCAVSAPLVQSTCARIFPTTTAAPACQIVSLEPHSLDDVWETIRVAGNVLGLGPKAESIVTGYQSDLGQIQNAVEAFLQTAGSPAKPKVAFLEWHDPFVSGGHWIANMLEIAGGNYSLNKSGQPSTCISDETLLEYDPDVILIGPCGFSLERATQDTLPLLHHKTRKCWQLLRAVQNERVYALDGNSYFARPGPRLVQGTGLMAECMFPGLGLPERLAPSNGMKKITTTMYNPIADE